VVFCYSGTSGLRQSGGRETPKLLGKRVVASTTHGHKSCVLLPSSQGSNKSSLTSSGAGMCTEAQRSRRGSWQHQLLVNLKQCPHVHTLSHPKPHHNSLISQITFSTFPNPNFALVIDTKASYCCFGKQCDSSSVLPENLATLVPDIHPKEMKA
jgi:hypothetical protein